MASHNRDDNEDAHMDSDDNEADEDDGREEIQLQNDSIAHFDAHGDSIFCIAQHPLHPNIIATGAGDDTGYIFDAGVAPTRDAQNGERASLPPVFKLEGHTDSLNALTFTRPDGQYLLSAGLDGQIRAYRDTTPNHTCTSWKLVAFAREVDEINFLVACPHPSYPNTVALGASDGSVWIYTVDGDDATNPLQIVQAFYLHTGPCTAGAWTPDGKMLCTVAEDGSFYTWDVFGDVAAVGLTPPQGSQNHVVGLTAEDERFKVDGGLYSVAVSPGGAFAAVGGAEGHVRIVGLPRLSVDSETRASGSGGFRGGAGAKSKTGGGKQIGGPKGVTSETSAGQAGQILASLLAQSDSVETISFSQPPLTLMAVGSVDGSIILFDARHGFAVKRNISEAHDGEAVIKVEFVTGAGEQNWLLTSCGNDGILKRWDTRGSATGSASAATQQSVLREWKGHRGGGEGGGVLGFVQGGGSRVVTAGDE